LGLLVVWLEKKKRRRRRVLKGFPLSNLSTMSDQDSECEVEDDDYDNYYNSQIEDEYDANDLKRDMENLQYECLRVEEVEKLLNELVEKLSIKLNVSNLNVSISKFRFGRETLIIISWCGFGV